jgi:hypothetical protein
MTVYTTVNTEYQSLLKIGSSDKYDLSCASIQRSLACRKEDEEKAGSAAQRRKSAKQRPAKVRINVLLRS